MGEIIGIIALMFTCVALFPAWVYIAKAIAVSMSKHFKEKPPVEKLWDDNESL